MTNVDGHVLDSRPPMRQAQSKPHPSATHAARPSPSRASISRPMPLARRPRSKSDAAPFQKQAEHPACASADEVRSAAARFPNFARDWDAYLANPLDDVDEDAPPPVPAPVGRPLTPSSPGALTRVRRFLSVRVRQPTREPEAEPEHMALRSRLAAALDIDFSCPGEDYHTASCCASWTLYMPRAPVAKT